MRSGFEENRKARVLKSMSGVIEGNWNDVRLRKNVPGYTPQHLDYMIESVGVFWHHKLVSVRLVDVHCTAAELMQDICGVFRSAIERMGSKS